MKASILLLCWNHEKYIRQCLESIFNQTHKEIEILFLDNVSKDNSFQEAQSILEGSGYDFKIYRNSAPQTVTKNLNFLLERASGAFIFPFSADDWMAPDNISEKINLLQSNSETGLVFGGGWLYFEDTNQYIEVDKSKFKRGDIAHNLLLDRDSYFYVGPAYKRSAIETVGKWDESLLMEDLDMNLRVALKYKVDFVPKSLIYYRRHSSSYTGNYKLLLKSFEQYYQKYKDNKDLPIRRWMSETYKHLAFPALNNNDYKTTLKFLCKSILLYPGWNSLQTIFSLSRESLYKIKPLRKFWKALVKS